MEIQNLKNEIKVFYVIAPSFPEGIPDAHQKLCSQLSSTEGRRFFDISYGVVSRASRLNSDIIYTFILTDLLSDSLN